MYPVEHKTLSPPNDSQENENFLGSWREKGPIPQPTSSQYRPPQLDTNPNVRKDKTPAKRKRVVPTKRVRANTASEPKEAVGCSPPTISKAPTNIKPQVQEGTSENRCPPLEDALVCESTSWSSAGKISGNLFEERSNWPLPPNYLDNNNAKDVTGIISPKPSIKEEPKAEEQSFTNSKTEKCGWGPNCPFCKNHKKGRRGLGLQLPKANTTANTTPTEDSDAPSKVPPRLQITRDPRTFRNPIKRHPMIDTWVSKKSTSSGKQRWRDLMLSTI